MDNTTNQNNPSSVMASSQYTYISAGTKMVGTLKSTGDVDIAGVFRGDVSADGALTLRSNMVGNVSAEDLSLINSTLTGDCVVGKVTSMNAASKIEGNVSTEDLICAGTVKGDITAEGNVDFSATSVIRGDVTASSVTMERGSVIVGRLCIE